MAGAVTRKPKAKRPGRPRLPKAERREVLPVRLPSALIARARAYGAPGEVVEQALTAWLDQCDGRTHEILARRTSEDKSTRGE